jgi:hypothetical protein
MSVNYSSTLIVGGTALIGTIIIFFGYNQFYKKKVEKKKKISDIVNDLPNSFNVDKTLSKHKQNIEMKDLKENKPKEEESKEKESKENVEQKIPEVKKEELTNKSDVTSKPTPASKPTPESTPTQAKDKKNLLNNLVPSAPPLEIDNEDDSIMEIPNKDKNAVRAQDLLRDMSVDTVKELPKRKRRGRKKKKPRAKEV